MSRKDSIISAISSLYTGLVMIFMFLIVYSILNGNSFYLIAGDIIVCIGDLLILLTRYIECRKKGKIDLSCKWLRKIAFIMMVVGFILLILCDIFKLSAVH